MDLPILAKISVDDWERLIEEYEGSKVQNLLTAIARASNFAESSKAARTVYENAVDAVANLCGKSKIRRLRLQRWGLDQVLVKKS